MKKALVYSPYWDTEGGGEKYVAAICQFFLKNHYQVDIAWKNNLFIKNIRDKFGYQLNQVSVKPDLYDLLRQSGSWLSKLRCELGYDLTFWVTDGSIPWAFSRRNIIHFQVPFSSNRLSWLNRIKLKMFQKIICNSYFTKRVIDRTYDCQSLVVYPPVTQFQPLAKKKIILSVGRFDSPSHNKRHDVLITAFRNLGVSDWDLVLAGGLMSDTKIIDDLKKQAQGLKVIFMENPGFEVIKNLYGEASIYWHAAGYGENLALNPEKAEHFGIATAEAMSSGAVPVVFNGGGQPEIVQDNQNGCLWRSIDDLVMKTDKLIRMNDWRTKLGNQAIVDAKIFSQEAFEKSLKQQLG